MAGPGQSSPAQTPAAGPASWDDPEPETGQDERRMRNLLRAVAIIMAVPAWSIAVAYLLFEDPARHAPHIVLYTLVGIATVIVYALAPRWARRFAGS